ncbi:MAG: choice-of-anchor L domain-containing protein [Chitinophagales bacterium]
MKRVYTLILSLLLCTPILAQIGVINSPPLIADTLAQRLVGYGLDITNAQLTCGENGAGYFFGGTAAGFPMGSGILLTSGTTTVALSPNNSGSATAGGGPGSDLLEEFPNTYGDTYNACILEFDFTPQGDTIKFNFIYGSEEYPEYVGSQFNDIFAFIIDGLPEYPPEMTVIERNIATIPGNDLAIPIAVNTLNHTAYNEFYIDNTGGQHIQYDGFTTNLTAKAKVTPCNTYHLSLGVADVGDGAWDSGVFLEEGSFISNTFFVEPPISDISEVEELDFVVENCGVGEVTFRTEFPTEDGYSLPLVTAQNINNPDAIVVGGTAQLFLDYTLSAGSVEIPENGTDATIEIYPIVDGVAEEDEYITFAFFASCSTVPYAVDTFWIYDEISAVVPEDIDICDAGTEVQLYGWESNGLNLEQERFYIRWEPSAGLSCNDCLDPIATITETSTYTFIIGYEGTICSDQESITINVDPNTANFDALPDFNLCANQTATLSASGGLEYEWLTPDGQDAQNLSCIDCPNPTFTPPNNDGATYIYNVIVSSGPGCAEEFPVEVTVDWADLSLEPVDPICPGDFATLSVASGDGNNFVWTKTNGLPAGNGPSIEVNPSVTTTYTVVALDVACPNPKSVTLVVDQVDAAFNPVQTVCAGEAATLVGQGGQQYQWLDADGNVLSTSQTYNPVVEENTTFQLVAQTNNCFDTIPVLAAIEPIREIQFITESPVICGDITSVDLAIEPITGVTFVWEPAGAFTMNSADGSIVTATPPSDGFTYTVTAVTPLGCTPPQSISVAVGENLEITVDAPEILCLDLNEQLTPFTINAFGAETYTWTASGGGSLIANPGASSALFIPNSANNEFEYTVVGTDAAGICTGETTFMVQVIQEPELAINSPVVCAGESATLTADIAAGSGDFSYEWIPTTGLSNPNSSSTEVTIDEPTTYTLIAIDLIGGCEVQQEVLVEVNQYPEVTLVETVAACNGEEVTITAEGGDGFAMTWTDSSGGFVTSGASLTVSPSSTTTYSLEVGTDCPVILPTTIEIIEVEVALAASAAQICDGEEIQLEASGTGIATFEWTQANGLAGTTGATQTATPTSTTTYIVTGYDAGGNCTSTAEVTVEVANIQVQIPPDPFTCGADDPATLTIDAGEGATYLWDPPTGLSSTTSGTVTATPSETTPYSVQVVNAQGCEETVFVTVNVFPPIEISVDPPFVSLCPGETATYTLTGADTYDFEEVSGGSFQILSNENGVVEITATANASFNIVGISENGCRAETTAELAVNTPLVSAGGDASICEGESTELVADGGVGATYQWNNADSMDDPTSATPTVFPTTTTSYEVVITDNNGCSATEQVTIVISQPAVADLTATPEAVCPGTAVVLQAGGNPNNTYTFYDQTGAEIAQNSTGQTVIIPTQNMTYTVIVETPDGCTDEAVASVDFSEDPVLEAQDGVACPDGSTIMTVSSTVTEGMTYNWTPNNILTCNNPECSSVTVSPTNATPVNFTITGTTTAGCSAETQAMISIEDALSITVSPANPELCIGETITLQAGGATEFTWDGPGLSTTTGGSVEVDINAAGTYEYTLVGANGECSGNTTFSVVINDLPTIEADLAPTLCVGDEFSLTATGGVDYEWTLGGESVGNLNVSPITTTTYDVIGTDANGCSNVSQVTVEVEEPIQLSVTTDDDEICFGSSTSIMATGAVSFEWSTTDVTGDGELLNVSPDVTTTYTVIATSANGCTTEGEVTVDVLDPEVALAAAQTGFCTGDNTSLTATGTGNYTWEGEGVTGTGPSVSIQPVTPGLYTYIVTTNINGCTATADVEIEVYAEPEVIVPQLLQICKDGSTEITATGADTYEWIDPNGSLSGTTGGTVTASPIAGTTYTVVGTSINGCTSSAEVMIAVSDELLLDAPSQEICIGDADGATLTVAGAQNYTWTGDDLSALSATTGNSVIATPAITTTYTIVGTDDQGCSGETQVTVVVNDLPQADAGEPGRICVGDDFPLTATGGTQYIWDDPTGTLDNPNIANPVARPNEPTTYTVTVINENGCSSTSEVFVDLEPVATALVPQPGETCSNALFDVTGATAENALGITWTSSGNGTFTDASSLETSYQPDASDVGTVTLTMSVEGCGSPSASFDLLVKQSTAELGFDPTIPVCPGISIPIAGANIGIGDINNVSWSGGLGSFESVGDLITEYRPAEGEVGPIVLTLTADDECGTVSDQITIEVMPEVNMDAGPSDTITEGESINLQGTGGLTDNSYIWTVVDGFDPVRAGLDEAEAALQSPLVTPLETTTYQLASSDNCSDVSTVEIIVLPTGQITMPNAFSPNSDGFNDVIFPVGFNFELIGFRIYSRWGEKVFETDVPEQGWDGFYLGEPAELGAYAYVVEYSLNGTNTTEILAGSITLIR